LLPRPSYVAVLRLTPSRAGPSARRLVRVPDTVLFPQRLALRFDERALSESRDSRLARRREDGPEAPRRLPARTEVHRSPRYVHDAADVDGAHIRDDYFAVRPCCGYH